MNYREKKIHFSIKTHKAKRKQIWRGYANNKGGRERYSPRLYFTSPDRWPIVFIFQQKGDSHKDATARYRIPLPRVPITEQSYT